MNLESDMIAIGFHISATNREWDLVYVSLKTDRCELQIFTAVEPLPALFLFESMSGYKNAGQSSSSGHPFIWEGSRQCFVTPALDSLPTTAALLPSSGNKVLSKSHERSISQTLVFIWRCRVAFLCAVRL